MRNGWWSTITQIEIKMFALDRKLFYDFHTKRVINNQDVKFLFKMKNRLSIQKTISSINPQMINKNSQLLSLAVHNNKEK